MGDKKIIEHYFKVYVLIEKEEDGINEEQKKEIKAYNLYHKTCFMNDITNDLQPKGSKLEGIYEDGMRLFSFEYHNCPFEVEKIWKAEFGEDHVRVWDNYIDMFN